MTWNIQICQGTQEEWVQRSFFSYRNIYSSRNNYHRPQSPFIPRSHTARSLLSFLATNVATAHTCLYFINQTPRCLLPAAGESDSLGNKAFGMRSNSEFWYPKQILINPWSLSWLRGGQWVSCLHICVRGRKTSSLLAFPRQVEEVLTQTFFHRLKNLCSFPALTSTWRHPDTTGPRAKAIKTQMHFMWAFLRQS